MSEIGKLSHRTFCKLHCILYPQNDEKNENCFSRKQEPRRRRSIIKIHNYFQLNRIFRLVYSASHWYFRGFYFLFLPSGPHGALNTLNTKHTSETLSIFNSFLVFASGRVNRVYQFHIGKIERQYGGVRISTKIVLHTRFDAIYLVFYFQ